MSQLLDRITSCQVCKSFFDHSPRPVVSFNSNSKIAIIGQAPGRIVQNSGVPWDDNSGDNLRSWLGVTKDQFYNAQSFALVPMGFCYPGSGKSGDLPPRKECAPLWHQEIITSFKNLKLVLLVGSYAQDYYLPDFKKETLTKRVKDYEQFLPKYFALPHPSPRNNIWMAKNPWFAKQTLPQLKQRTKDALKN